MEGRPCSRSGHVCRYTLVGQSVGSTPVDGALGTVLEDAGGAAQSVAKSCWQFIELVHVEDIVVLADGTEHGLVSRMTS